MLTIGQLAAYVGVTVRAIRHYHQRGLLPEPARDASGYRRYDGQAVVDLVRIRTLSEAGVPLARIEELLNAEPEQFSQAVTQLDEALTTKIRDLEHHRGQLGELVAGERLVLPGEVADYLDLLRGLGVSARTVQMERDGWILLMVRSPEQASELARQKRSDLADKQFQHIYLTCDQAFDWDPADPRLAELADAIVAFAGQRPPVPDEAEPNWSALDPTATALLESQFESQSSPSWQRLNELCVERMQTTQ
jgi:DNA-binding transcriptional MerR regulator